MGKSALGSPVMQALSVLRPCALAGRAAPFVHSRVVLMRRVRRPTSANISFKLKATEARPRAWMCVLYRSRCCVSDALATSIVAHLEQTVVFHWTQILFVGATARLPAVPRCTPAANSMMAAGNVSPKEKRATACPPRWGSKSRVAGRPTCTASVSEANGVKPTAGLQPAKRRLHFRRVATVTTMIVTDASTTLPLRIARGRWVM